MRELNSYVRWTPSGLSIALSSAEMDRMAVLASAHSVVREFVRAHDHRPWATFLERDRWRLGAYYATDSLFRMRSPFSLGDALVAREEARRSHTPTLNDRDLADLVDRLVTSGLLELQAPGASAVTARESALYAVASRAALAAKPPVHTQDVGEIRWPSHGLAGRECSRYGARWPDPAL